MNIAALLAKTARTLPERPAVSLGSAVATRYGELDRRAGAIAGALRADHGLAPGDRVAIVMANRPDYLEALFGIWYAGLVAVPVNAKLHPRESVRADAPGLAPPLVAGSDDYRAMLDHDPADPAAAGPDDPAWLFYTSGTTGRPKGATITHRNLLVMTLSYFADLNRVTAADCVLHAAPLSHGSGLYALPFIAKGANNVIPESGGFEPAEVLSLIECHPGLSINADTTNLDLIIYGGGPMYVADVERALAAFGPKLAQIYGQGEAPMTITALSRAYHAASAHPRFRERLGSAGIARTDVEVRVVGEDDRPLPAGESGEIIVRGDVVMPGYWENPEATASALKGGWLHTGDDMIISGGTNIYPREIEEVLLRDEAVREAAVVGRAHAEWGEEVVAFVVPHDGHSVTGERLDRLCLESIARFKRPRDYRIVDGLPKNNYGKVLKRTLREELEAEG
ncbi:Long-chain-fatty-acid--CoA ligase [Geodia barretti]|uniref:Medium-chain acyl-CoA ligase ACSF2, mitochondrial n=1 Tax=Geodia barretti TaxID=519541 RepID=A0AA35S468_GEOBA|nr:Long-chain-fatty-acid--CoA ligase [Geodia barretti]